MSSQGVLERISMWMWRRRVNDPDLHLVLDAAGGLLVDSEALASAYWRVYYGTYRPRDEWQGLPRDKRDAVYRLRLRLISAYAGFDPDQQDYVSRMRPPAPRL
jgi:hypothetical protein